MAKLSKLAHKVVLLSSVIITEVKKRKKSQRRRWTKDWLLQRVSLSHVNLLKELKFEKDDRFNYLRMDEDTFLLLLQYVTPYIRRKDSVMRKSISAFERLVVTLRFLATGRSYADLKFSAVVSASSLTHIIPETCRAIYEVLRHEYLKFPKSEEDWRHIAKDFEEKWNFPHALGAVDGKHVRIIPPANSGSFYFNYKGYHSMVLLAIVNANYEFILVDFGVNGRISDGGVLEYTEFYRRLQSNKLNIPKPETCEDLPFVFIGDEAFSLRENFMKPFSQKSLTEDRRIYNNFLSRARRVVENAFGILSARFRIFHTAISLKPDNIDAVVMACCALHNFLRRQCASTYINASDLEGSTTGDNPLVGLQIGHNRNCSLEPKSVREMFVSYFRAKNTT